LAAFEGRSSIWLFATGFFAPGVAGCLAIPFGQFDDDLELARLDRLHRHPRTFAHSVHASQPGLRAHIATESENGKIFSNEYRPLPKSVSGRRAWIEMIVRAGPSPDRRDDSRTHRLPATGRRIALNGRTTTPIPRSSIAHEMRA